MSKRPSSADRIAALEATVTELTAKVHELEDDRAIRDLLARYGYMADTGREEAFVNLYTDDGALRLTANVSGAGDDGFNEWHGKDAIREFNALRRGHHRMHIQGPNLVTYIDGDEAVANGYQFAIGKEDGVVKLISAGNNQWSFRRVDGAWYIKERRGTYLGDAQFDDNMDATPE